MNSVNQKVKNLSGGQKNTRGPYSCFIMFKSYYGDEPTGALDEIKSSKVYRFLKASQRRLILIVSHDQKFQNIHLII